MLNFSTIPLSTERLLLRPFAPNDAPALFRLNSDPEILKWTTWQPLTSVQQASAWIETVHAGQYDRHGYGRLAVTLRETGELIGWSGVKFAEEHGQPTLGYRFFKSQWGKGLATEAAAVSLLHAFYTIGLSQVHSWIFADNIGSRRVLEKCGFESSGTFSNSGAAQSRFTIYRPADRSFRDEPLFESRRLAFHPITADDAGTFYALNSDKEVVQYTGDPPFESLTETREFLLDREKSNARIGYGRWKIVSRYDGECIGWCGLKLHEDSGITDVGYRLFRRHWGNGYASEAARATIDYGFQALGLDRIVAHARKENVASLRVLEKCGMRITGTAQECGGDIFVWELLRSGV